MFPPLEPRRSPVNLSLFSASHGVARALGALRVGLVAGALLLTGPGTLLAQSANSDSLSVHDPAVLPGDLVSLLIPEFPDLNGGYTVTQFGTVTLPVIGEFDTTGMTSRMLKAHVRALFAEHYRTPGIEVVLSKRVRVLGAVNEPGLINVDPTMTFADALALAMGRTPEASQDRLILRRGGEVIEENRNDGRRVSDLHIQTGDELFVPQRPWLSRNLTAVATSLLGAITVIAVTLAGSR